MGGPKGWGKNNGGAGKKGGGDWLCQKCTGADGSPFRNFAHRLECKNCRCAKSSCTNAGKGKAPPNPAHRTLAVQQEALRKAAERAERAEKKAKQQEEVIKKLTKEKEAGGQSMEVDAEEPDCNINEEMQKLKKDIAAAESIGDEQLELFIEGKKAKLLELQQRRVAARPLPQRLRDVAGKIDRKEKAIRKKQDEEVPKLQKILDKAAADLEEANEGIKKLQEELEEARSDHAQMLAQEAAKGKEAGEVAKENSPSEKLEEGFRIINSVLADEGETVVHLAQADGTPRADLERMWRGIEKLFRTAVSKTPGEQGTAQEGDKPSAQATPVGPDLPDATANADGSPSPGKDHDQPGHGIDPQLWDEVMGIADPEERKKRGGELLRAHNGKSSRR